MGFTNIALIRRPNDGLLGGIQRLQNSQKLICWYNYINMTQYRKLLIIQM